MGSIKQGVQDLSGVGMLDLWILVFFGIAFEGLRQGFYRFCLLGIRSEILQLIRILLQVKQPGFILVGQDQFVTRSDGSDPAFVQAIGRGGPDIPYGSTSQSKMDGF